jgi:hypothetical protein
LPADAQAVRARAKTPTSSKETSFFIHAPPFAVFFCRICDPHPPGRMEKQNFVLNIGTIIVPTAWQPAKAFETPWKFTIF